MTIVLFSSIETPRRSSANEFCNLFESHFALAEKLRKPFTEVISQISDVESPNLSRTSSAISKGDFLNTLDKEWQGIATSAKDVSVELETRSFQSDSNRPISDITGFNMGCNTSIKSRIFQPQVREYLSNAAIPPNEVCKVAPSSESKEIRLTLADV